MAPDIGSGRRSVPDKQSGATLIVTAAYIASQMIEKQPETTIAVHGFLLSPIKSGLHDHGFDS